MTVEANKAVDALRRCVRGDCASCDYKAYGEDCRSVAELDAAQMIVLQSMEIEELRTENEKLRTENKKLRKLEALVRAARDTWREIDGKH